MNPKEFLDVWWAKHGDEIFQFMVGKVNAANERAEAAEAEAAALRERERWISVEEKLPGENVRVHIWFLDTGKEWRERYGEISCGHWRPEGGNGNFDDRVTHWKALSAAPEL